MKSKTDRFVKKMRGISLVFLTIFSIVVGFNFLIDEEAYGSKEEVVVVVQPGDTLWTIAKEQYPDKDIEEAIYHIRKSNGLKSSNLQIGTVLSIPNL